MKNYCHFSFFYESNLTNSLKKITFTDIYLIYSGGGNHGSDENSKEEDKMQDALSSAIVREKPNVKWSDVAGLDQAKSSL